MSEQTMNGKSTSLAVIPTSDIQQMAEMVVKSRMFPDVKTVESAFCLMMLCQSEGIHPMMAVRRYHIIKDRPAMKADAMLGEFQKRGGRVKWLEVTHDKCSAVFSAPGIDGTAPVTWTIDDAKRARIYNNPGEMWQKYPRQMLRSRVISEGVRMTMPEIISGIYTEDEVEDFVDVAASPATHVIADVRAAASAPKVTTAPEQLADLEEPDADEPIDFVDCWKLHEEGSKKAHTYRSEWIKSEAQSQKRTLKQNKRLHALRNDLGLSDDDWHAGLRKYYNKESSSDLSIEEATDMIGKLEARWNMRKYKHPDDKKAHQGQQVSRRGEEIVRDLIEVSGVPAEDLRDAMMHDLAVMEAQKAGQ
jgi:hypothetical protein